MLIRYLFAHHCFYVRMATMKYFASPNAPKDAMQNCATDSVVGDVLMLATSPIARCVAVIPQSPPLPAQSTKMVTTTAIDFEESDEEKDLTNLTWLTELRNQTWPNGIHPQICDDRFPMTTNGSGGGTAPTNAESLTNAAADAPKTIYNTLNSSAKNRVSKSNHRGDECEKTNNGVCAANAPSASTKLQPQAQVKRPTPAERYEIFLNKIKRDMKEYEQSAVNYQSNTTEKPPFNYSHIIGMAMLENGRVTLQQICNWIEAKFAFFRVRKKWNNSIRHNLSLHHCFRKIDRNKYEKGKGGYWELGVDPKKCDRKRVRNRKWSQNKHGSKQKSSETDTTFDDKPNESRALAKIYTIMETGEGEDQLSEFREQDEGTADSGDRQQLLLDDLDVQQTIDIPSCSNTHLEQQQHQQQQEDILIANILASVTQNDDLPDISVICNGENEPPCEQQPQQQQYQLGTIIISTGAATDITAATALNCIINDSYCTQPQSILFSEPGIPSADCEERIATSYLANGSLTKNEINEFSIDANNRQQRNPQRPNVIVEHLDPPTQFAISGSSSSSSASLSPMTATLVTTSTYDYPNIMGDSFRPYVDGIEEAFQYLRSIENSREDILDNLLDISVSDY